MPAYQAEKTVGAVVAGLAPSVERVIVVDDGSTDRTGAEAAAAGAEVLRLSENGGKGTALRAGLERVLAGDATHVAFVGLGAKFQMWEPGRFEERRARAREKVHQHRKLFGAGSRPDQGDRGGDGGARE